tara:strand:- start:210 stop:359 length:150 start_codon:yes stop_codon:yes gene_type:complete
VAEAAADQTQEMLPLEMAALAAVEQAQAEALLTVALEWLVKGTLGLPLY